MIVTIHQPAYLPWLGYFDKIIRSDCFVFLDTVQFEKNSFTNRNKIKTPQGPLWLTVPVKSNGHLQSSLLELEIVQNLPWLSKHLKSIQTNYKKAPRFDRVYESFAASLDKNYVKLADLCYDQLLYWFKELNIQTPIIRSSELGLQTSNSQLILDICNKLGASRYISGALGRDYLDENQFSEHGISIEYQAYKHPEYPQLWGDFIPYMSVLDFWMNTGDYSIITGGHKNGVLFGME